MASTLLVCGSRSQGRAYTGHKDGAVAGIPHEALQCSQPVPQQRVAVESCAKPLQRSLSITTAYGQYEATAISAVSRARKSYLHLAGLEHSAGQLAVVGRLGLPVSRRWPCPGCSYAQAGFAISRAPRTTVSLAARVHHAIARAFSLFPLLLSLAQCVAPFAAWLLP